MFSEFSIIADNLPDIARGAWLTVVTWLSSMFFGIALGLGLAICQRSAYAPVRTVVAGFDTVIRGTPFLIQLFLFYYAGPFVGLSLDPLPAGILGLSVYSSAYFSEIFRGGFESIPKGQLEAARIFGLSRWQTLTRITMPQMLIVIFPSLVNMMIILVKETAVLSVITVSELTATLSTLGSIHFAYVPTLTFLALFYWIMLELLSFVGKRVETRLARYLTA